MRDSQFELVVMGLFHCVLTLGLLLTYLPFLDLRGAPAWIRVEDHLAILSLALLTGASCVVPAAFVTSVRHRWGQWSARLIATASGLEHRWGFAPTPRPRGNWLAPFSPLAGVVAARCLDWLGVGHLGGRGNYCPQLCRGEAVDQVPWMVVSRVVCRRARGLLSALSRNDE